MRRLKKILKWTGIIILVVVAGVAITVSLRQNLKFKRPYPNIVASADSIVIDRGRQLVFGAAHCADCHSKTNVDSLYKAGIDAPLTGGVLFDLPFGKVYTKNITPDKETGIGSYTDAEIARALRYGVHPDGTAIYDFMPFHNMSDEDLTAVISYLRAQKPVRNPVPDHDLNVMGKIIKAFVIKPTGPKGEVAKSVKRDTSAAYGEYLAVSVANCGGCHTKRDFMTGAYIGEPFAGGVPMGEPGEELLPPNLTPHETGRLYGWSSQDFIKRIRMGRLKPKSHMPWDSYGRMSDDDLKAIYAFLQTVKPVKSEPVKQ